MRPITLGMTRTDVISNSDEDPDPGVATPVTGWMPSGDWRTVRAMWWGYPTNGGAECVPIVQYSNDGINLGTAVDLGSYVATGGAIASVPETELPAGAEERLLVRFGFRGRRITEESGPPLVFPVVHRFMPGSVRARRFVLRQTAVATLKSSTNAQFIAASPAVPLQSTTQVRGTLEVISLTGAKYALGYRLSLDGETWSDPPVVLPEMAYRNSVGRTYGAWEDWGTDVTEGDVLYVQFGFMALDETSPSRIDVAQLAGQVELL